MSVEVGSAQVVMPQLQSVQKAMAIPTVEAAVGQMGALYYRVKSAHSLIDWALTTAEASVAYAATTAAPYVASHVAASDAKVAAAIDELGRRVPLVQEQPKVIVEQTKQAVFAKTFQKIQTVRSTAETQVKSLKELSWARANTLLSTEYGQKALHGVDSGASLAMHLLDTYLPAVEPQEEVTGEEIVPAETDPAMHTLQTVGRLSSVAARRVWANLALRVDELRKKGVEWDIRRYVAALLAALQLATVTRQQRQQEELQEKPAQSKPAEATPPKTPTPKNEKQTSPPTSEKVKTTPENKSSKSEKNKKH